MERTHTPAHRSEAPSNTQAPSSKNSTSRTTKQSASEPAKKKQGNGRKRRMGKAAQHPIETRQHDAPPTTKVARTTPHSGAAEHDAGDNMIHDAGSRAEGLTSAHHIVYPLTQSACG